MTDCSKWLEMSVAFLLFLFFTEKLNEPFRPDDY